MTSLVVTAAAPSSNNYVQIFYLKNPPTGLANVYVDFTAAGSITGNLLAGALNADGVDQATPIVGYGPVTTTAGTTAISSSINVPPNGLALDILARDKTGNASANACNDPPANTASVQAIFDYAGQNAGASSYCGPVSASGISNYVMGYTYNKSLAASYAQAVLQPDNSVTGSKRVRLGGSAGVLKWREVNAAPP
jgi:hypothetical protein